MRRLHHFNLSPEVTEPVRRVATPRKPLPDALPPDDMWRSRRVLSGSDWMAAWVRKPINR
ncbi:hypothetical protein [Roseateles sp.]|jgi:hypothetical protein|uniref:hypothetical protein n=1 Tax=Roseateles sp. TaxID=1971397 RepID=UPI003BAAFC98